MFMSVARALSVATVRAPAKHSCARRRYSSDRVTTALIPLVRCQTNAVDGARFRQRRGTHSPGKMLLTEQPIRRRGIARVIRAYMMARGEPSLGHRRIMSVSRA